MSSWAGASERVWALREHGSGLAEACGAGGGDLGRVPAGSLSASVSATEATGQRFRRARRKIPHGFRTDAVRTTAITL
jgi:hypothetical protein